MDHWFSKKCFTIFLTSIELSFNNMILSVYFVSLGDYLLNQICPENNKIQRTSFDKLETMDLCERENITTCEKHNDQHNNNDNNSAKSLLLVYYLETSSYSHPNLRLSTFSCTPKLADRGLILELNDGSLPFHRRTNG